MDDLDILAKIKAGTHVLVPVEPTRKMVIEGLREIHSTGAATYAYCAMIAAAQENR